MWSVLSTLCRFIWPIETSGTALVCIVCFLCVCVFFSRIVPYYVMASPRYILRLARINCLPFTLKAERLSALAHAFLRYVCLPTPLVYTMLCVCVCVCVFVARAPCCILIFARGSGVVLMPGDLERGRGWGGAFPSTDTREEVKRCVYGVYDGVVVGLGWDGNGTEWQRHDTSLASHHSELKEEKKTYIHISHSLHRQASHKCLCVCMLVRPHFNLSSSMYTKYARICATNGAYHMYSSSSSSSCLPPLYICNPIRPQNFATTITVPLTLTQRFVCVRVRFTRGGGGASVGGADMC